MTEGYINQKKQFSELEIFEEHAPRGSSINPALRIEGLEKSVQLTELQFRVLMFLRQRQGKPASAIEIEEFVYGDDESREVPLYDTSYVQNQIYHLNKKLLTIQDKPRFLIINQQYAGYYLVDLEKPETLREGGERWVKQLLSGSHPRKKRQGPK